LIGALALGLGAWYFYEGRKEWQTMVFTFLAFAQVFQVMASRSAKDSVFQTGLFGNRLLAVMALVVVILQLIVIYVPFMRSFFDVTSLSGFDLLIAIGTSALVLVAMEVEKRVRGQHEK
jgi:Ca2+-transporting ATPase